MKKRIVAALLAGVMCFAFTGCGKKKTSSEGDGKLTYWAAMPTQLANSGMTFNDLPSYKEYNKRTGIEVEFVHAPVGQDSEKFNLMIASGNLPDIVETDWPTYYQGGVTKAVSDGVVIPIDDVIEEHAPNLFKILSENEEFRKMATTRDGKYYGFPKIELKEESAAIAAGLFIRKDYLDKVGMDVPTNVEEWDKVLRAFKNELGVEIPLTVRFGFMGGTHGFFNTEYEVGSTYYLKDGKVKYAPLEPGYKGLVETLAAWYKDGLFDSEFAVITADAVRTQIQSGKSGAFYGLIGNDLGKILAAMKETDPDVAFVPAPFPKKDQGNTDTYIGNVDLVEGPYACITKNCDDVEKAAKWIDYCYGKEGSLLYHYGIEGLSYNMVDGVPVFTELVTNNPDGLGTFEAWARYARGYSSYIGARYDYGTPEQREQVVLDELKAKYPYQEQIDAYYLFNKDSENRYKTQLPVLEYDTDVAEDVANIKFEIETYVNENVVRFISGDRPMSEWGDFVKELKSLNSDKLLGYMQDAYEQYLSK